MNLLMNDVALCLQVRVIVEHENYVVVVPLLRFLGTVHEGSETH